MSEENIEEQVEEAAVSEQAYDNQTEEHAEEAAVQDQKMVPLAALEAERRKRQELEARANLYQEYLMRDKEKSEPEEPEDPTALVENRQLQENTAMTKREILESVYQDVHPEAVQKINQYLKPILEKKPWLAASVDSAQNRYARAYEIVTDYMHLVEEKPVARKSPTSDGRRIVENAAKPRSPAEVGKSAQPTGVEYLKSIQGKKEFREYRQKVLRGEA